MNVYISYCSKIEESLLPEFELFYLFIIILIFHIIFTIKYTTENFLDR